MQDEAGTITATFKPNTDYTTNEPHHTTSTKPKQTPKETPNAGGLTSKNEAETKPPMTEKENEMSTEPELEGRNQLQNYIEKNEINPINHSICHRCACCLMFKFGLFHSGYHFHMFYYLSGKMTTQKPDDSSGYKLQQSVNVLTIIFIINKII